MKCALSMPCKLYFRFGSELFLNSFSRRGYCHVIIPSAGFTIIHELACLIFHRKALGISKMLISAFSQIPYRIPAVTAYTLAARGLSTTACLYKNRKSGIPKITQFRTKPLTYEEAQAPFNMYVRKGWLSWNTCNLYGEGRKAETTFEDFLIRKFMFGTWHQNLVSEVVIKRRHNIIVLSFLVAMDKLQPRQVYFLQGYTEELLSTWLKCPVKVELQTVDSFDDVIFKKI